MSARKLEHCCECDCPTGRAGRSDDSLYFGDFGPFCEDCYDAWPDKINEEISQLRAQLAEAQKVEKQEGMVSVETVKQILTGIDQDQCEADHGWWETSKGVEFGQFILKQIEKAAQGEG